MSYLWEWASLLILSHVYLDQKKFLEWIWIFKNWKFCCASFSSTVFLNISNCCSNKEKISVTTFHLLLYFFNKKKKKLKAIAEILSLSEQRRFEMLKKTDFSPSFYRNGMTKLQELYLVTNPGWDPLWVVFYAIILDQSMLEL